MIRFEDEIKDLQNFWYFHFVLPRIRAPSAAVSPLFFFFLVVSFSLSPVLSLCVTLPFSIQHGPSTPSFGAPLFWAFHVFQQRLPSFTSLRFQRNYLIRNTAKRVADWAATCAGCRVKQERRRSSIFEILLIHATAFQDPCFFNRVTVFFHTVTASNVGIVSDAYFMPLLSAI